MEQNTILELEKYEEWKQLPFFKGLTWIIKQLIPLKPTHLLLIFISKLWR